MDVKNAFLNGDLIEKVYMQPLLGYPHPPHKVCNLHHALNGLKQALCAWFTKFSVTIQNFGFSSSPHDSSSFIHKIEKGSFLLLLYVDNMILTGDDLVGISQLKHFLSKQFEKKDLGCLNYFWGLEISSDSNGYYLSQSNLRKKMFD